MSTSPTDPRVDAYICALLAAKDHVYVFIYDPSAADPEGINNQGQGNKTVRTVQIYRDDAINERAVELFRADIASNREGGWRKLQASRQP